MKKLLAVCSVFFSVCAFFTGCGNNMKDSNGKNDGSKVSADEPYESNFEHNDDKTNDAGDYVSSVIEGVEDAGEDIVEGAGDAASDVIDGLDGDKSTTSRKTVSKTTTTAKTSKSHR